MSKILTPGQFNLGDQNSAAHLQGALSHLIEALTQHMPGLAEAAHKGFHIRITLSNGIGTEFRGGANPNFKLGASGLPGMGLVKP